MIIGTKMRFSAIAQVLASLAATAASVAAQECTSMYTDLTGSSAITYRTEPTWISGKRAWCFPFTDRTSAVEPSPHPSATISTTRVATNPVIYIVYPDGTSAGAPIVSILPCEEGYSDAFLKYTYQVDYSVKKDTFRDYETLNTFAKGEFAKDGFYNHPIVPPGSSLEDTSNKKAPEYDIQQAWYKGKKVFFFDFGAIQQNNALSYVQAAAAVEVFGDDAFAIPVRNGFTVLSASTGPQYTGFFSYRSADTTGAPFNYLRHMSNFSGPTYPSVDRKIVLNCPVVYQESFVYKGDPPVQSKPSMESTPSLSIPPPPPPVDISTSGNCFDAYLKGPASEYFTAEAFAEGSKIGCWNLGLRSNFKGNNSQTIIGTAIQPVYDNGLKAGLPVFSVLPCQPRYSDAILLLNVVVSEATPFNLFKDFAGLKNAAVKTSVGGIFNYPIVEIGSKISINPADSKPELSNVVIPAIKSGWFQGKGIEFVDFGRIPDLTPNSDVISNGKVIFSFKDNGAGQKVLFGNPVFDVTEGDPSYTGFYGVNRVDGTETDSHSRAENLANLTMADMGKVLNCPTAYFLGA
ncbi:hypothetical protein BC829DRAFT_297440 [Chytridium lagenaria]|nr:hypothetical protein BC829DRAFT_297440 [Chytridium lagenaria]